MTRAKAARKSTTKRATRMFGSSGATRRPLAPSEEPADVKTEWLLVSDLKVDHAYQRDLSLVRVKEIIAAFDPDLLGVLLVSHRTTGTLYLLDGQTRHAALVEMGWGDQRVPCLVYSGLTRKDEARIFVGSNVSNTKPSPVAIFKGKLAAGDPDTVMAYNISRQFGYLDNLRNDFKSGSITSPTAIMAIFTHGGPDLLEQTMAITSSAWPGQHVASPVLKGIGIFVAQYGPALQIERVVQLLAKTTADVLVSRARQLAVVNSRSASAIVQLLVADYNTRLRFGRLIYTDVQGRDTWKHRSVMLMTETAAMSNGTK